MASIDDLKAGDRVRVMNPELPWDGKVVEVVECDYEYRIVIAKLGGEMGAFQPEYLDVVDNRPLCVCPRLAVINIGCRCGGR